MSDYIHDIIIVGAGPVGGYLSSKLSEQGYKVLVLEKNNHAGENVCCTGIVSNECYNLLNLDDNIRIRKLNSVNLISPLNRTILFKKTDPIAVILDRPELNKLLIKRAATAGATCIFSTEVISIENSDEYVTIRTKSYGDTRSFHAQMVILSTGYGSGIVQKTIPGNISSNIVGAQTEVTVQEGSDITNIYMDHKLAPGGFGWFVHTWENRGLAGMLCNKEPKLHQKLFLDKLIAERKITYPPGTTTFALIPLHYLRKTFDDRILIVGEAAGQVKPTTGGGIYYGLLSANIAIEVINGSFSLSDFSSPRLKKYQTRWQKLLKQEILAGRFLQSIYAPLRNSYINSIFSVMKKRDVAGFINDNSELHFDRHSKIAIQILGKMMSSHRNK